MDFSYYLAQYLSQSGINLITFIFVISFFVWEIPRTFRMLEKEWMKGIYSEAGRAVDAFIFVVGIAAFFFLQSNLKSVARLAKTPIFDIVLAISAIALPVILMVVFAGRIFSRIDSNKEMTQFFGHTILDLVHTTFQISFVLLALPSGILLLNYFL